MNFNFPLILASNSPRRQLLLKEAGINFFVKSKDIAEDYPSEMSKEEVPVYLAQLKAEAFRKELAKETVIAADTIVTIDNKILNKPSGYYEGYQMLTLLSGKKHEVITGVCILNKDKSVTFSEKTDVYFKPLSHDEIDHYLKTYEPYDKAGGYGIQEWIGLIGIEKIEGSYFNVVGLPVNRLVEELRKF